jgi:hypothetical protein
MAEKLMWQEIEAQYDQNWVELIDYKWNDSEPYPRAGIVRSHAPTRKELSEQVRADPVDDSAVLFVGEWNIPAHALKD